VNKNGVICVGRVYCDLVFSGLKSTPTAGREIYADQLSLNTGGGAAITSYYLAQLGRTAKLCANLPSEPFATTVKNSLREHVNTQYCSVEKEKDPQVTVVLTGAMDRSFVTNRVGSALPTNYSDSIRHCSKTNSISHLHIGELATLIDHPDLVTKARSANWTISLDCAWDSEAMQNTDALALIESVDVFLPNESEFEQLTKLGLTLESAPVVVVKQGAAGAVTVGKDGPINIPAEKTTCIDTTGAGDAFNAGFIHAWLQKLPMVKCLESGHRCGAIAVGRLGGIGIGIGD